MPVAHCGKRNEPAYVKFVAETIAGLRSYLRSTQRRPDIVRSYFHADCVRYAAA